MKQQKLVAIEGMGADGVEERRTTWWLTPPLSGAAPLALASVSRPDNLVMPLIILLWAGFHLINECLSTCGGTRSSPDLLSRLFALCIPCSWTPPHSPARDLLHFLTSSPPPSPLLSFLYLCTFILDTIFLTIQTMHERLFFFTIG